MSERHLQAKHPAFAAGLVLVLGLLAGCESDSSAQQGGGSVAAVDPATGISEPAAAPLDPRAAALAELARVGDRVLFATDRYDLTPAAEAVLRAQAALLQSHPAVTVTIEGHADERGTREYNLALADRRAATVRNYLAALGIAETRIGTVSYGKERPECPEAAESCWASNRRGVTVLNP